jgi:hypothetical protein
MPALTPDPRLTPPRGEGHSLGSSRTLAYNRASRADTEPLIRGEVHAREAIRVVWKLRRPMNRNLYDGVSSVGWSGSLPYPTG